MHRTRCVPVPNPGLRLVSAFPSQTCIRFRGCGWSRCWEASIPPFETPRLGDSRANGNLHHNHHRSDRFRVLVRRIWRSRGSCFAPFLRWKSHRIETSITKQSSAINIIASSIQLKYSVRNGNSIVRPAWSSRSAPVESLLS